jgi:uncharacterized protein (DUF2252 family)
MNVLKRIQKANQGRDPMRLAMKYRTMRNTPFGFLRGACHLFNAHLVKRGGDTGAPAAWSCGDLHLENFGSYEGINRQVYFDINDFDEAALAPATWDLIRLATSVHVAFSERAMPSARIDALTGRLITAYANALADGEPGWIERDTAHGAARQLFSQLHERSRTAFLDSRTRVVRRRRRLLVDGVQMLPLPEDERAQVTAFMQDYASRQPDPDFYRVLDVACRVAGTGSLGVMRYAVLVEGKGSPDHNVIFDLKQARTSSLARLFKERQPRWDGDGERIATVQGRMQAEPAACLQAVTLGEHGFVLRALQPSEDHLNAAALRESDELADCAMDVMGRCLAWAQLRGAGWRGAAEADALVAFAGKQTWRGAVAQAALEQARQNLLDWETFAIAYDAGKLRLSA